MKNSYISKQFSDLANLLEIQGENPFKVRAYRNAAIVINNLSTPIEELIKDGKDLTKIPGIGTHIAKKIEQIIKTGKLPKLEKLKKEIPPSLLDLLSIEGLGAKRVKILYEKLNITNLEQLQLAAKEHKISALRGFGKKIEEKILHGLKLHKQEGIRWLYANAEPIALEIKNYLLQSKYIKEVTIAGSFRRKKETVGDLDIVAVATNLKKAIEHFVNYSEIKEIISQGVTRSTIVLNNDLQIDLRVCKEEFFGSMLHYFSGSKAHVINIRKLAIENGFKINEYGIFKGNKKIASKSEKEIYNTLNLDYIEPELRENRGEIRAAKEHTLPNLIDFSNKNLNTNINPEPVTLEVGSPEIFNYPYLDMTGHGNVVFSIQEAENLRNYLIAGGFLHISDNYGMDKYIRLALKSVFPEAELVELPFSHPIYHQQYDFNNGLPKIHKHDGKSAQGFGLFYKGRLVVFYDYECDLGDGWEDISVHNDTQEKHLEALKMGANILQYVFSY